MLKGKNVHIRLKRQFLEQKLWSYIGKVTAMSENWIALDAKGVFVLKGLSRPVSVDDAVRTMVLPRESVLSVRVLPDDFSLEKVEVMYDGTKLGINVPGGPPAWIGEAGEG
jgi:hypothetical protein